MFHPSKPYYSIENPSWIRGEGATTKGYFVTVDGPPEIQDGDPHAHDEDGEEVPFKCPIFQLAGGFKYFLFSPLPGETVEFDYYFSNGLVQPPPSQAWQQKHEQIS